MEYVNGRDLEAILQKTSSLPIDKIIEWAIDLCDVLQYLHDHQPEPIIFRDMKPANIMIDSLGKVRLIDFGIAKIFVKDVKNTMIGTEGYSAPEQYKGDVNPLSDIYSLGATLHQVITRKDPRLEPPFSFSERALKDFNEEATPGLQAVIDKALQFESENRYQSCAEMKADLGVAPLWAKGWYRFSPRPPVGEDDIRS
jgi:serine/threonine protein kinase